MEGQSVWPAPSPTGSPSPSPGRKPRPLPRPLVSLLPRLSGVYQGNISLPSEGSFQYKFVVDGRWTYNPNQVTKWSQHSEASLTLFSPADGWRWIRRLQQCAEHQDAESGVEQQQPGLCGGDLLQLAACSHAENVSLSPRSIPV